MTMLELLRSQERDLWLAMHAAHDESARKRTQETADAFKAAVDEWAKVSRLLSNEATMRANAHVAVVAQ